MTTPTASASTVLSPTPNTPNTSKALSVPTPMSSTTTPKGVMPITSSGSDVTIGAPCLPDHEHGPKCGHIAIQHDDHVGYLHDGHLHCKVKTLLVQHVIESRTDQKFGCATSKPVHAIHDHEHHDTCGHERVPHDDHFDYLVGDELHHQHDGHCDSHGIIRRRFGRTQRKSKARGAKFNIRRKDIHKNKSASDIPKELAWYRDSDTRSFVAMFIMTGGFFFVELIWGLTGGSLALVADAMHMLSDTIALVVGFYALRASKRAKTDKQTYGWTRMEVVAGLCNGMFLIGICFTIMLESLERFLEPPADELEKNAPTLLIVASVGLGMNIIGLFLFGHGGHGHSHGGGHGHSHGGGGHDHGNEHGHAHADEDLHDHGHSHGGATQSDQHHGHSHGDTPCEGHDDVKSPSSIPLPKVPTFVELENKVAMSASGSDHGHSHGHGDTCTSAAVAPTVATVSGGSHAHHGSDDHDHDTKGHKSSGPRNMNMHGVLLHVLGDAFGSIAVIISMVVIQFTDWPNKTYADPVCSLVISALILASSIPLVKACVRMLLQSVPSAIDLTAIRAELLATDGVVECHELHIWQLNTDKVVASVHVLVEEGADWMKLCDHLKLIFHSHGIHNSTLQPEFVIRDRRTHQVIKQGLMDTCHEPVCGDTDCSKKFCCPPVLPPTTPLLAPDPEDEEEEQEHEIVEPQRIVEVDDMPDLMD